MDRFALVHSFICRQKEEENGYSTTACLKMFGVSHSSYYGWLGRQKDKDGAQARKEESDSLICEKMRQVVVARNGIIPGKRTFRVELFRRFQLQVSLHRVSRLMKKMNLVAQLPHRDAYKHQASHNHVCAAPANGVAQNFFVGPRQVILTDITYLYYGPARSVFYLCVFRDAYVRQNLGWSMSSRMDVGLVKEAYEKMMYAHRNELKRSSVYIHSDQGSQYLSTTFQQILEDDEFIQSVSARGNSQDNAPMESFFGRLKTNIMDMVARCMNLEDAMKLVNGYLEAYNGEHFQYELAGLTPNEFYQYATTGIYPLDNYFGVPASEMMATEDLSKVRRVYADEEARKRREAAARKREERRMIDPIQIVNRDRGRLRKFISQWTRTSATAAIQLEHLKEVLSRAEKALAYLLSLPQNALDQLRDPLSWRRHEELSYVFSMNELF